MRLTATLEGDPWHLWGLSKLFDGNNADAILVKAKDPTGKSRRGDHAPIGHAFITSDSFFCESFRHIDGIGQKASDLVSRVNGLARLVDPDFTPVRLVEINHSGERSIHSARAHPQRPNRLLNLKNTETNIRFVDDMFAIAKSDSSVQFVLEALSLPSTWASLYLIFETIQDSTGGKLDTFVTDREIDDFKHAANNSRNARQGSRHGGKSHSPKKLINMVESRKIISTLTTRWLHSLRKPADNTSPL